jgi:hypothetical protein
MFWPCRVIGPNGEQCALEAGHEGQHIPRAAITPAVSVVPEPPAPPPAPSAPLYAAPPPAYPPAEPAPPAQPVAPAVTGTPWGAPPKGRGRGPLLVLGLGVVALLVVGAGAVVMLGNDSGEPAGSLAPSRPAVVVPGASATAGVDQPGATAAVPSTPSPAPSTAVRPIGLPTATGTPTSTTAPAQTTSPLVTPAPAATTSTTPAGAPAPTSEPLGFGTLSYSGSACFEVDWKDTKGRQISGAEARYAITIKNPRGAKSANLWIGVQTTDQFTTDPLVSGSSWSKRPKAYGDESTLVIAGPRLDAGKTRVKWRVFYQTPIDVHTSIWIAEGPSPSKGSLTLEEIKAASPYIWDVKTNVKVCY